jgi:hypothetical protein
MTAGAPAFPEEDFFPYCGVAGYRLSSGSPIEAANVAHQLPDLVGQHIEASQLRAGNALSNILKDLGVPAAVQEISARKCWSTPSAYVTAVAGLAHLLE